MTSAMSDLVCCLLKCRHISVLTAVVLENNVIKKSLCDRNTTIHTNLQDVAVVVVVVDVKALV